MSGTLYLVGTPIGNRGDMTPRAREILAQTAVVACEDTRTCRRLFSWLELPAPAMIAYHDRNAEAALPRVLNRLSAGDDVALVAEAGMPTIQDPGYRLVAAARRSGMRVVPVPGPSALLAALAASGLPTDGFVFLGFAPRRSRAGWWRRALARSETVVVFEAPGRVTATLAAIAGEAPDRPLCLARELTKVHEEFVTGAAWEVAGEMAAREGGVRGECVLVVGGAPAAAGTEAAPWREALEALAATRAGRELSARDRVEVLACAYPADRNAIYDAVIERGSGP